MVFYFLYCCCVILVLLHEEEDSILPRKPILFIFSQLIIFLKIHYKERICWNRFLKYQFYIVTSRFTLLEYCPIRDHVYCQNIVNIPLQALDQVLYPILATTVKILIFSILVINRCLCKEVLHLIKNILPVGWLAIYFRFGNFQESQVLPPNSIQVIYFLSLSITWPKLPLYYLPHIKFPKILLFQTSTYL